MKKAAKLFTGCILSVTLAINIASFVTPDQETSFLENRSLTQLSAPTKETLINGSWFSQLENYLKDQIVGRELWMKTYYAVLDTIGVNERNGYVKGKENYILPIYEHVSEADLAAAENYGEIQVSAMMELKTAADQIDSKLLYVNIPSKMELYPEKYPELYENDEQLESVRRASILQKMKAAGIETVETYDTLKSHKDEYIYYATDHHFTDKGAYYVYQEILKKIPGMTFPEWDELNVEKNAERMAGSYLRSFGDSGRIDVDYMEYALPKDMPEFTRVDDGEVVERKELYYAKSTSYTSFMGGDIGNTVIDTGREALPNVLYVGFSFTNALETYSVYNFDKMESLDPRHWEGSICDYIAEAKPDYIIVVRDDLYEDNPQFTCTVR